MAENNAVTKEDLQIALNEVAGQLTKVIKETVRESAEATEAKLTAEMDRRFADSKNDMLKRFRRADRKHQALQQEVKNQFLLWDGKIMIRFDKAEENAEKIARGYYRELVTVLDGYAGKAADLELEQGTLGSEQDKLRAVVEENHKSNGAAITGLKQRVNALEEKVFAEPAK